MTAFPTPDEFRQISPSADPLVLKWQHIASMDRESAHLLPLLSSLTTPNNRSSTINLRDADARITLNFMDKVISDGKIPSDYEHNTLRVMRELAYNSRQVPIRYQVDRRSLTVEMAVIASGALTDVRRGRLGGKTVAIRTLRNDWEVHENESQKLFCKEAITWMTISHPNILQLIGVDIDSQTGQCSTISETTANGNIKQYIRRNSANKHHLLEDVASGLCYLHECGIVHGDLKGNNILITNDVPPRARLADFGLATLAPSSEGATTTETAGGTLLYMAPELLFPSKFGNQSSRPTKPADMYALGMVIYEVLTGSQPFHDRRWGFVEVMHHVVEGERPTKPGDTEEIGFGDGTWELVEECWREDPTRRPTVERALRHLTHIAASSAVVGPSPEKSHGNSPEFGLAVAEGGTRTSNLTITTARDRAAFSANHTILTNPTATTTMDGPVSSPSTVNMTRTRFSNFAQHENTNPGFRGLSPGNPHPPSPMNRYQHSIPADQRIFLLQWRDPEKIQPIDHQQFTPLVDVDESTRVAFKFGRKDVTAVISTIDKLSPINWNNTNPVTVARSYCPSSLISKVLKRMKCPEETRWHAFKSSMLKARQRLVKTILKRKRKRWHTQVQKGSDEEKGRRESGG